MWQQYRPIVAITHASTSIEERRFTMWLRLTIMLTCLFMLAPNVALSADQHVLGTITAIDATHVEIKTAMGQLVNVQVDKKTRYKDESNPKKVTMPEVGNRVVIMAEKIEKKGGNVLAATAIHFSSAKRVPAPTPPAPVH
jgi:hypothetical protein